MDFGVVMVRGMGGGGELTIQVASLVLTLKDIPSTFIPKLGWCVRNTTCIRQWLQSTNQV